MELGHVIRFGFKQFRSGFNDSVFADQARLFPAEVFIAVRKTGGDVFLDAQTQSGMFAQCIAMNAQHAKEIETILGGHAGMAEQADDDALKRKLGRRLAAY